jgi:hypothetical protein
MKFLIQIIPFYDYYYYYLLRIVSIIDLTGLRMPWLHGARERLFVPGKSAAAVLLLATQNLICRTLMLQWRWEPCDVIWHSWDWHCGLRALV